MARNYLCKLATDAAIKAIEKEDFVYYRRGVWNEYSLRKAQDVAKSIKNAPNGADVYEEGGKIYVSVPCDSDMW